MSDSRQGLTKAERSFRRMPKTPFEGGTLGAVTHFHDRRDSAVRNDPWNAVATYNGRRQSLFACLMSWRRDARRGSGALGTITTNVPVQIDGWSGPICNLGASECLDLLAIMPSTYSHRDIQRLRIDQGLEDARAL
jgi:hypothetical protein